MPVGGAIAHGLSVMTDRVAALRASKRAFSFARGDDTLGFVVHSSSQNAV